jgi:hypothetical protein
MRAMSEQLQVQRCGSGVYRYGRETGYPEVSRNFLQSLQSNTHTPTPTRTHAHTPHAPHTHTHTHNDMPIPDVTLANTVNELIYGDDVK